MFSYNFIYRWRKHFILVIQCLQNERSLNKNMTNSLLFERKKAVQWISPKNIMHYQPFCKLLNLLTSSESKGKYLFKLRLEFVCAKICQFECCKIIPFVEVWNKWIFYILSPDLKREYSFNFHMKLKLKKKRQFFILFTHFSNQHNFVNFLVN